MPLDYAKPGRRHRLDRGAQGRGHGAPARLARGQPRRPGRLRRRLRRARPDFIVSKQVRDGYDIVGFDPRGVGSSQPGHLPATTASSTPSSARTRRRTTRPRSSAFVASAKDFAAQLRGQGSARCWRTSPRSRRPRTWTSCGPRSADQKLDYLGKSYGTFLGATYADLFPTQGRPVRPRRRRRTRPHARRRSTRARPRGSSRRPAPTSRTASRAAAAPSAARVDAGMQRLRGLPQAAGHRRRSKVDDPHVTSADRGLGLARDRRGDVRPEQLGPR